MNSKIYSLFLFICMVLFVSCNKEDDGNPEDNPEFTTATYLDNVLFEATQDSDGIAFMLATLTVNGLTIQSRQDRPNNNFITIKLFLANYEGPGTYYTGVDEDDNNYAYLGYEDSGRYYSGSYVINSPGFEPGIITITKDDGVVIEGTFNFIGFNGNDVSTLIENGKFKVGYGAYP